MNYIYRDYVTSKALRATTYKAVMAEAEMFEALLKVVIIGDSCVGKTCIILRYAQETFRENFLSTIGENFTARVTMHEGAG